MATLGRKVAPIPPSPIMRTGVVVPYMETLGVNVNGAPMRVTWPGATYIPQIGDAVSLMINRGRATVIGPVAGVPLTADATVMGAPVSGLLPVQTTAGENLEARYVGTAPAIGSAVFLDWSSTIPKITSASTAAPWGGMGIRGGIPAAPPGEVVSGTTKFTPIDSGTYGQDMWNPDESGWDDFKMWGKPTNSVAHGYDAASHDNLLGAWFYGDAPRQLAGATVDDAWMWLPRRRDTNPDTVTTKLWWHSSDTRPSGDVVRDPAFVAYFPIAPDRPSGWVRLPFAMVQQITNIGGGIGMESTGLAIYYGIDDSPISGQLWINWRR